ncbi:SPARC [Neodiprion virginianus]|uniref:SPARC n=1 Tax=Neodiprion virginianus TaxID=2961670 RepID=UPI001EE753AE|nr:SPARC [Neodiprion virginianus]
MRATTQLLLGTLCVAVLLLSDVSGKHHGHRSESTPASEIETQDVGINEVLTEDIEDKYEAFSPDENNRWKYDPCMNKHCSAGRTCKPDDDGVAQCVCVEECEPESDARRKVCTNLNETWSSDCEVHQARCFCVTDDPRCKGPEQKHVHVEYYGECREMPECTEGQMADFPRRMRDWLFNVMRDLADRRELTEHFLEMQQAAAQNFTIRWRNAVIWKWCDLDGSPHDRVVSRHELFPIRAPLMALEHCIAPFLDACDADGDHKITLREWGKCLEIEEDDLDDKCGELVEMVGEQD